MGQGNRHRGDAEATDERSPVLLAVGAAMKARRVSLGLSQEHLSACGFHRTYAGQIESGKANPTLLALSAVAAVLEVPIFDGIRIERREDGSLHPSPGGGSIR